MPPASAVLAGIVIAGPSSSPRQHGTILFVDIRGFTAYAEKLDPGKLSVFISSFRRRVMRATEASGGMVDKFIGDGALIVLVFRSRRATIALAQLRARTGSLSLSICGTANVVSTRLSEWGSAFTAAKCIMGSWVMSIGLNSLCLATAAKIEQATKRFDASLLASEVVVLHAGHQYAWEPVGREPLGSRGEHVALFAAKALKSGK